MKLRRDFLLALFILFAIPVIGYLVLQRAASDRMKVSSTLQPKDSLSLDLTVNFLNAEGVPQTRKLVDMPYVLKVVETRSNILDLEQTEKIMYIINDRSDLAFLLWEPELKNTSQDRILGYNLGDDEKILSSKGDVLLVDAFNRILQVYDGSDSRLYSALLEDISYAFPMVDFRLQKLSDDEKQK